MLVLLMCDAVKGADGAVKFCFEWALSAGCLLYQKKRLTTNTTANRCDELIHQHPLLRSLKGPDGC